MLELEKKHDQSVPTELKAHNVFYTAEYYTLQQLLWLTELNSESNDERRGQPVITCFRS